jgi:hypothetical protein
VDARPEEPAPRAGASSPTARIVRRSPGPADPPPPADPTRPRARVTRRTDGPPPTLPASPVAHDEEAVDLPLRVERTGRGPITASLARFTGVLAVLVLILAIACVGLLIAVVGSRQPDLVATTDPFTVDRFHNPDGSPLGRLFSGGEWEQVGRWEVVGGATYLVETPDGRDTGFALLPGSSNRSRIAATFYGLADDAGIVTRYQGPDDYVSLTPVPDQGTWLLRVIVDGETTSEESVGLVGTGDGTRAEIVVRDDNAWVIINGRVTGTYDIAAAPSRGQVGMVAGLSSGSSGRFDDIGRERG